MSMSSTNIDSKSEFARRMAASMARHQQGSESKSRKIDGEAGKGEYRLSPELSAKRLAMVAKNCSLGFESPPMAGSALIDSHKLWLAANSSRYGPPELSSIARERIVQMHLKRRQESASDYLDRANI